MARRGKPRFQREVCRRNRVVTFVTDEEILKLTILAEQGDLSNSALCHQLTESSLAKIDQLTK
jgi:hypothetical protein